MPSLYMSYLLLGKLGTRQYFQKVSTRESCNLEKSDIILSHTTILHMHMHMNMHTHMHMHMHMHACL
jgi:hypothetical protein